MKEIPRILDGADILFVTDNTKQKDFGSVYFGDDHSQQIKALAICQHQDQTNEYYVFACNENWDVIGDLVHSSVAEAKEEAGKYYQIGAIEWIETSN